MFTSSTITFEIVKTLNGVQGWKEREADCGQVSAGQQVLVLVTLYSVLHCVVSSYHCLMVGALGHYLAAPCRVLVSNALFCPLLPLIR